MKFGWWVSIALLLPLPVSAQDITISCDGSPEQAVLAMPAPADRFLQIVCTRYGHIVNPVPGWLWTVPGTMIPQFYPAQMVTSDPQTVGNTVYFNEVAVRPLSGEPAARKWSLLAELFDAADDAPSKVLEIVATSSMGESHTLYIFPNHFGYSCSPDCRAENAFLMINENGEDVSW